jgi:hypothetical protein
MTIQLAQTERALTFGEKMVGVDFNPSANADIDACKRDFAAVIDSLNGLCSQGNPEAQRLASIAIAHLEMAQMLAVKAIVCMS